MKKGVLFKTVRVLLVLAASLAIAKVLWVLRPEAERQELADNGRLVEVFAARAQTLVMTVEAYGTVQPRESLDLVAEVKGRVAALGASFVEGAAVNQGDLLIAIDPRTYELEVQAREAALRQVAAQMTLAALREFSRRNRALGGSDVYRPEPQSAGRTHGGLHILAEVVETRRQLGSSHRRVLALCQPASPALIYWQGCQRGLPACEAGAPELRNCLGLDHIQR